MRSYLSRVRLVVDADDAARDEIPGLDLIACELPTVHVEHADACGVCDAIVDADAWIAASDLSALDEAVAESPSDAMSVRGRAEHLGLVGCQVLGRYQRFIDRRNAYSRGPAFDAVLRRHRGLLDDDVVAGRALDRWQWLLRIAPNASFAAQAAALFRDATAVLVDALVCLGVARAVAVRALRIARDGDPDLEDAEGLSFLSLDSPRATRREVVSVAASLRPVALAKIPFVHLTPQVRHWLFESVAA